MKTKHRMETKFRTGQDVAPKVTPVTTVKPGQVPEGRLGIYDHKGRLRGHVGKLASSAICNRFGVPDAELSTENGRPCWRGKGKTP